MLPVFSAVGLCNNSLNTCNFVSCAIMLNRIFFVCDVYVRIRT